MKKNWTLFQIQYWDTPKPPNNIHIGVNINMIIPVFIKMLYFTSYSTFAYCLVLRFRPRPHPHGNLWSRYVRTKYWPNAPKFDRILVVAPATRCQLRFGCFIVWRNTMRILYFKTVLPLTPYQGNNTTTDNRYTCK